MKTETKIPELRFPEFEGEWVEKKLGDIGKVSMCKRILKNQTSVNGEIPFFKIGTFGGKADSFIDKDLFEDYKKKYSYPKIGDILISAAGTIGRTVIFDGTPSYFQDSNIVWIDNNEELVKNELLAYCYQKIRWITENTTIPRLYNNNLRAIKIVIPRLKEQQKIATFLTAIDRRLQLLEKKKAALAQYKKGVMQKIFSQEIRFKPAPSETEGIKNADGELVELPDWEEKMLGEVFSSVKGQGLSKNKIEENGKNECVLYGELYTTYAEVITNITSKTNSNEEVKSKAGDLLVPCSTTTTGIDLANVTALNKADVLLGGDITILRSKENIDNIFYAYYLSNYKKNELARFGQGTTIVHLYYSHFKVMKIDVPVIEEQQKIASFLSAIDKKIEKTAEKIKGMQEFKQGLLQKMFC